MKNHNWNLLHKFKENFTRVIKKGFLLNKIYEVQITIKNFQVFKEALETKNCLHLNKEDH